MLALKLALIEKLENKSTREGEQVLRGLLPMPVKKDRERILSQTESEIRFTADSALLKKLHEIKCLLAHKNVNPSNNEVLHEMADFSLAVLRKKRGASAPKLSEKTKGHSNPGVAPDLQACRELYRPSSVPVRPVSRLQLNPNNPSRSRYISASVKRQVWSRDHGICQYVDPLTGKACGSTFGLELDHRYPFAWGGGNTEDNLQLLCKTHNNLRAVQVFAKTREILRR